MFDKKHERELSGRTCRMTHQPCYLRICVDECSGLEAAESILELNSMPQGSLGKNVLIVENALGPFSPETRKAITEHVNNEPKRLQPFRDLIKSFDLSSLDN